MMDIQISRKLVLGGVVVGNFVLSVPHLFAPFRRVGVDYTAYIAQAGQFVSG